MAARGANLGKLDEGTPITGIWDGCGGAPGCAEGHPARQEHRVARHWHQRGEQRRHDGGKSSRRRPVLLQRPAGWLILAVNRR